MTQSVKGRNFYTAGKKKYASLKTTIIKENCLQQDCAAARYFKSCINGMIVANITCLLYALR